VASGLLYRFSPMRRAIPFLLLAILFPPPAPGQPEEPFRPKGAYDNSVHRFHPDLDFRLNAVRYGRWRALQIAWKSGINDSLDREFSAYLRDMLADPPRFAPEADRVAPGPAREAAPIFRALRWGQMLEQQFLDILASADSSPALSAERLDKVMRLYRREPWALSEPETDVSTEELVALAPASSRILASGTKLFALAASSLVSTDFADQRWKIRKLVADFNPAEAQTSPAEALYASAAPDVASAYSSVTATLDRLARFRAEVFAAMIPGGATPEAARLRDERLRAVARRYGLPVSRIGRS
jgi:hypothetical protein